MESSRLGRNSDVLVRVALTLGVGFSVGGVLWSVRHTLFGELGHRYAGLAGGMRRKIEAIQGLEGQNHRLEREAALLRRKVASLEFRFEEEESRRLTSETKAKLVEETGSPVGKLPEQISFRPPPDLSSGQLLALGLRYFNTNENEKAAVIFQALAEGSQPRAGGNSGAARIRVLAGIAWYRLRNYKLADRHFSVVLAQAPAERELAAVSPETPQEPVATVPAPASSLGAEASPVEPELLRYQAQARLWKGLVARALGSEKDAQHWFEQLIDHHPHSEEAGWINRADRGELAKHSGPSRSGAGEATEASVKEESHGAESTRVPAGKQNPDGAGTSKPHEGQSGAAHGVGSPSATEAHAPQGGGNVGHH